MQGFSYTQLVQALQDWPQDTSDGTGEYIENIPRIIGLGELRLVKDLNLDIFDAIAALDADEGETRVEKPNDWIATRTLWRVPANEGLSGERTPMHLRSLGFLRRYTPNPDDSATYAPPLYYAEISETEYEIAPVPDDDYQIELHYIRRPEGLSDDTENTWLGDRVGDVLLVACLMEAEHFLKADDRYSDMRSRYYEELLPVARAELRRLVRGGDYNPIKPAAKTVE